MTYLSKIYIDLIMKTKAKMRIVTSPTNLPTVVVKGVLGAEWIGLGSRGVVIFYSILCTGMIFNVYNITFILSLFMLATIINIF